MTMSSDAGARPRADAGIAADTVAGDTAAAAAAVATGSSDRCGAEDARASVELVRTGAPGPENIGSYKAGPAEDPVILTVCLVVTGIALARPQAIRNPAIAP